jgi:hypothetical protein
VYPGRGTSDDTASGSQGEDDEGEEGSSDADEGLTGAKGKGRGRRKAKPRKQAAPKAAPKRNNGMGTTGEARRARRASGLDDTLSSAEGWGDVMVFGGDDYDVGMDAAEQAALKTAAAEFEVLQQVFKEHRLVCCSPWKR